MAVRWEAVGGSSGQVKEALCWNCFDLIFSLSLPCFRSIPSSSLSALTFAFLFLFFLPRRDGWWVEHDFQRQNITGLSEGAAFRVTETAVSGRLYLNWLQHTLTMYKPLALCLCLACLVLLAAEGKREKGRRERQRSSRRFLSTDDAPDYDKPFLPGEQCL